VQAEWFEGVSSIGLTSGASTPESSVRAVVDRLKELGVTDVEEVDGIPETIEFTLPLELRT
jgi:4-hydroxy-3-methylbut-2-enyl diphosphate reductase